MKHILILASFAFSTLLCAETYSFDTKTSTITWTGSKPLGKHTGDIKIKAGSGEIMADKMIGEVQVDMTSINNLDQIKDPDSKAKLETHLKSEDFFDIKKYPTAVVNITGASVIDAKKHTYNMTGRIRIKDKDKEITFPATVVVEKDQVTLDADLTLDRTEFGVNFHSKKFDPLKQLGDKIIHDDFTLKLHFEGTNPNAPKIPAVKTKGS